MLVVPTVHRTVLKTLGTLVTGDIKPTTKVIARKVRVRTNGKGKEDQVGGIEGLGVVARPVQKVGRVTKAPREKRVKRFPMVKAGDPSCSLQERSVRDLTTSSMAP